MSAAADRPARPRWSIASRLSSLLILAITGLWLAAVTVAAALLSQEINEVFDSALQENAQRLLPLVIEGFGDDKEDEHGEEARVINENLDFVKHEEYLVYQVRDASGRVLLRSHNAPVTAFPAPLVRGESQVDGWRFFTESYSPSGLYIQVAEPLTHRREAVFKAMVGLVAPLGLLIPLAALAIFWTVRRSLTPLEAVRQELDQRGGANLAPLSGETMPKELAPIIDDVNLLLARLGRVLESERAFAANSAHELRTPVAAALAQTQRLASELQGTAQSARVDHIAATLRRLGDLVEKLLQLARAEAGIALSRDPVDVMPVIALVVEEFTRRAGIAERLAFDAGGRARLLARIDIDAFGIVLRNLIDNALHHGPAEGRVEVFLDREGALHVVNEGPVVPPERLRHLTDRFERAGAAAPGAGLGLAIVETILAQSGGSLALHSPAGGRDSGFEAVLRLDPGERAEVQPSA